MAGCVWLGLALLFVVAIACAARRRLPAPTRDDAFHPVPGRRSTSSLLAGKEAEEREAAMDV
jgi:hypothetical protein